ncbi:hypothetical protein BSR28_07275 [Boudabousia liubingyangii]|uniref:aggregation-promoting factor C-terminal-like domain-containing protein n=1 Tax=Boudabousia liubingyangii TaxID=1921764 RepID=UPI000938E0A3|nr:ubiquitin-like domain-containing protein [Boudabousia liubingyangii]OKL46330.1 hypothetical protein BSR28_07275 [Boudabousia liubingyangii]
MSEELENHEAEVAQAASAETTAPEADAIPHRTHREKGISARLRALPARGVWTTAVVASLAVAGLSSFQIASSHHRVTLNVDGTTKEVSFFGNTVADALKAGGVEVSPKDHVTPALDSEVFDNSKITFLKARPYQVQLDGKHVELWSTGKSSSDVLADLSARKGNVAIAASRSEVRNALNILTTKDTKGLLIEDGKAKEIQVKAGQTIDQVLAAANVKVSPIDQVKYRHQDGKLQIHVDHVQRGTVVTESEVPFKTVKKDDANLLKGETKVENEGKVGKHRKVVYREIVGGKEVLSTVTFDANVENPVDRVELNGTKEPPKPEEEILAAGGDTQGASGMKLDEPAAGGGSGTTPAGAQAIARQMVAARGWGDGEFRCLVTLWNRESNWNYRSLNRSSGAYGIPQSLPGSKMASAGADWRTNPATQIRWGLGYISGRYGTPCAALSHSYAKHWY